MTSKDYEDSSAEESSFFYGCFLLYMFVNIILKSYICHVMDKLDMNTSVIHPEVVRLRLSNSSDLRFLKELAQRMGWSFEREEMNGLDKSIEDLKAGHLHHAKDVDELMSQLMR